MAEKLFHLKNLRSRQASMENPDAQPGAGGMSNNGRKGSACLWPFPDGSTHTLLDTNGPGMVRHIWITIPPGNPMHMRNLIIRIYWDRQEAPSVEVPLGDFFGVAHGQQKPLTTDLVCMQEGRGFNCWIPMPFRKHARITVENDSGQEVRMLFYQVDFTLDDDLDKDCGYFHAQFRRQNPCPFQQDYTILDGVQGRGVYLGTILGIRSRIQDAWWGEGEVKFYIDGDKQWPTICGTGAEDYIGSAWGLSEVQTPVQGSALVDNEQRYYSIYRFHSRDPIYFQEDLKVTIQQIGCGKHSIMEDKLGANWMRHPAAGVQEDSDICYFECSDDWSSVAMWYQELPAGVFPPLPDREARSADLPKPTEKPKRADQ